jgi:hypothetical protein
MLSKQILELLTAFVDGELSQRQRKAVMRVLQRSSEARDMLRQLQENAHKLKKLPRHKVEPSLVEAVIEAITEHQAQPKPATRRAPRRAWAPYVVATMAASLLIAVIGMAYWNGMFDSTKDDGKFVKNVQPEVKPIDPKSPHETPNKKKPLDPFKMTEGIAIGVGSKPVEESYAFRELRDATSVGRLADELNTAKTAVHVDVTVKNNTLAMDRLRAVLKEQGITVVTDPDVTKALIDKKQPRVEYLVFAENLHPDAVAKLMSELSQEFVVPGSNNQRTEQSPYDKFAIKPIGNQHKQQLAELLGTDPGSMERKSVKPAIKTAPVAVLLPTSAGPTPSKEVRQFVESRRPQPGTLQILIRIHQE